VTPVDVIAAAVNQLTVTADHELWDKLIYERYDPAIRPQLLTAVRASADLAQVTATDSPEMGARIRAIMDSNASRLALYNGSRTDLLEDILSDGREIAVGVIDSFIRENCALQQIRAASEATLKGWMAREVGSYLSNGVRSGPVTAFYNDVADTVLAHVLSCDQIGVVRDEQGLDLYLQAHAAEINLEFAVSVLFSLEEPEVLLDTDLGETRSLRQAIQHAYDGAFRSACRAALQQLSYTQALQLISFLKDNPPGSILAAG
jgi:hypothetical protein